MKLRKCSRCGKEQPETEKYFRKCRNKKNELKWFSRICRECNTQYSVEYGKKHQTHKKESVREYHKEYDKIHFDRHKDGYLKKMYGITLDQFKDLLMLQENKCAICGELNGQKGKKHFAVDHDHENDKIRGILCNKCNRGLGYFNDNIELLTKSINYLKQYNRTAVSVTN